MQLWATATIEIAKTDASKQMQNLTCHSHWLWQNAIDLIEHIWIKRKMNKQHANWKMHTSFDATSVSWQKTSKDWCIHVVGQCILKLWWMIQGLDSSSVQSSTTLHINQQQMHAMALHLSQNCSSILTELSSQHPCLDNLCSLCLSPNQTWFPPMHPDLVRIKSSWTPKFNSFILFFLSFNVNTVMEVQSRSWAMDTIVIAWRSTRQLLMWEWLLTSN